MPKFEEDHSCHPSRKRCPIERRLKFFGHVARDEPDADHISALQVSIDVPVCEWKRPKGRPAHVDHRI